MVFSRGIAGTKLSVMSLSLAIELVRAARHADQAPHFSKFGILGYAPSWPRFVAVDHVWLSPARATIVSVSPHSTAQEQTKNIPLEVGVSNQ
jgi:hypothetical protein